MSMKYCAMTAEDSEFCRSLLMAVMVLKDSLEVFGSSTMYRWTVSIGKPHRVRHAFQICGICRLSKTASLIPSLCTCLMSVKLGCCDFKHYMSLSTSRPGSDWTRSMALYIVVRITQIHTHLKTCPECSSICKNITVMIPIHMHTDLLGAFISTK